MSRVVGVHGVWKYRYFRDHGRSASAAAAAIGADWSEWLGAPVTMAYYSQHLHRGTRQGSPSGSPVDVLEPAEQEAFVAWAESLQPTVSTAQGRRQARARQAADWVTRRFGAAACSAAAALCGEAETYLATPEGARRTAAREAVSEVIDRERPEVLVAHSLGSVVAYEALWARPEHKVDLLVTVGSPLAMPMVIVDRLLPAIRDGRGARPPGVRRWVDVADVGDIVAVPRGGLGGRFDGVDAHHELSIGEWAFHNARAYLGHPVLRELIAGRA